MGDVRWGFEGGGVFLEMVSQFQSDIEIRSSGMGIEGCRCRERSL